MKVTAIKTFICNAFRTNFVFVKVETDAGIHGWGEATLEYKELTIQSAIHDLESYLIGKDPHNIEAFRHDCYRDAYWRGGPVLMSALAGVEMALYGDRITVRTETEMLVFPHDSTAAVTVLGRNKLNIYAEDKVYQFKGGKRFNALKYVNIYHRAKNLREGSTDEQFLGL